MANVKHFDFTS